MIAIDEHGTIFAAVNGQDSLVWISPSGRLLRCFPGARLTDLLRVWRLAPSRGTRKTLHVIGGARVYAELGLKPGNTPVVRR